MEIQEWTEGCRSPGKYLEYREENTFGRNDGESATDIFVVQNKRFYGLLFKDVKGGI